MIAKAYPYRFEILLFTQIAVLFGSLIVPTEIFDEILLPILFQVNLLAGFLLVYKSKKFVWLLGGLLILTVTMHLLAAPLGTVNKGIQMARLAVYFVFYLVVTYEIIRQVWRAVIIDRKVILGLISGYLSLGLIGFFICLSIEMANPGSFEITSNVSSNSESVVDSLMYFSYISLMTIGYGDIFPATELAQKSAILIGLMGQLYMVVLTAIVVGKYINQLPGSKKRLKQEEEMNHIEE